MSYFLLCFIINVIFSSVQVFCVEENYYWREYTGKIPNDAVVGGKDINNKNIYIGQAYVKNGGLLVVQIKPGIREVYAPFHGPKKVDKYIKILCGPQESFYWLPANNTNLHLILIDKHAVIGGHEDGGGYINIGRISHEGEIKIGKVNSWNTGDAGFYFVNKDKEPLINSYEILIYQDPSFDVRIKN